MQVHWPTCYHLRFTIDINIKKGLFILLYHVLYDVDCRVLLTPSELILTNSEFKLLHASALAYMLSLQILDIAEFREDIIYGRRVRRFESLNLSIMFYR